MWVQQMTRASLLLLLFAGPVAAGPRVNDVTGLNPVQVKAVVAPASVGELQALLARSKGPVSIGGARHSQGGQTACAGCLFVDMRRLNRIVSVDPLKRTVIVQAGATWRSIQEVIDDQRLAVRIMQDYANFTVGGTLSVNAHGSYALDGPVVNSVRAIKVVLADGRLVTASRTENADLFYGAIGGYGGLGVIVEATLDLAPNQRLERASVRMRVADYRRHFAKVAGSSATVMHSAALYPPRFQNINGVTFSRTVKPLTIRQRFSPKGHPSPIDLFLLDIVTRTEPGKWYREQVYDRQHLGKSEVMSRNYVASQDAEGIEPASRAKSTYVLQEYFVPVARFERFVPRMGEILRAGRANVLNIAIRHSPAERDTLLSWADQEVFCFVIYFQQGTTAADSERVKLWTRKLIQVALDEGGSYYLPYQIIASREQFLRAYPRAEQYFALKRRLDPTYKFRNRLWETYYRP